MQPPLCLLGARTVDYNYNCMCISICTDICVHTDRQKDAQTRTYRHADIACRHTGTDTGVTIGMYTCMYTYLYIYIYIYIYMTKGWMALVSEQLRSRQPAGHVGPSPNSQETNKQHTIQQYKLNTRIHKHNTHN